METKKTTTSKRRSYICPAIEIIRTQTENPLLTATGQHGTIGNGGGSLGNAKEANFESEDFGESEWE